MNFSFFSSLLLVRNLVKSFYNFITQESLDNFLYVKHLIENSGLAVDIGDTWLIGILTGFILIFILLSILSKIRPYILCGVWFIALMALYIWRSDYVLLIFPDLADSSYSIVIQFVLQCLPLILFLIINKIISVLEAKEHIRFAKIFTAAIWLSVGYLSLIILLSLISTDLVISNLIIVQRVFWVILALDGIVFLIWLIFSAKKNNSFLRFQSTFGLLFLVSVGGKLYMSATSFSTTYLKPKYLLWGIAAQLFYMYWLLLSEIFKNWEKKSVEGTLTTELELSIDNEALASLEEEANDDPLSSLSPRELDIFLAYCNGFSYTDISSSYFISPNTVKTHLKKCYLKLGINSKVEAIGLINKLQEQDSILD